MEENQRLKTANSVARRGEHGKLVRREVVHDLVRVTDVVLLVEVALNEALHVGLRGSDSARW